MKVFDLFGFAS